MRTPKIFGCSMPLLMTVLLAACGGGGGGGGGGGTAAVVNVDPQGYWTGISSKGYTVSTAFLDNGEVWGVYSYGSTIYGTLYGTSTVSGSNITVTGTGFDFASNTSTPGTSTGSVVAKSTMTLADANSSLPLKYQARYETAATAAAVSGTWSFVGRSGSYTLIPATVNVDASGNFSLVQPTCTSTGTVAPRAGGKNIYTINITTAGTGCSTGQSSLGGVLGLDTTVTPNKFTALALTPNKADGLVLIGTKL